MGGVFDTKEFEAFLEKKRNNGLNRFGEIQLQIAFSMGVEKDIIEFMSDEKISTKAREWIYISAVEGLPWEFLNSIPAMADEQVKEQRLIYLKDKEQDFMKQAKEWKLKEKRMERALEESKKEGDSISREIAILKNKLQQKEEEAIAYQNKLQELKESSRILQKQLDISKNIEQEAATSCGFIQYIKKRKNLQRGCQMMEFLKKDCWTEEQVAFFIECFEMGMRPDVVEKIAAPTMSVANMKRMRNLILDNGRNDL